MAASGAAPTATGHAASAAAAGPALHPGALIPGRWIALGAVVLTALSVAALTLAWNSQQRLKAVEAELIKRQQLSDSTASEARTLARQAGLDAREAVAKLALLDARVAETSLQRSQLEELIQSLARSRDENVLADIDATLRVAMQQSALTGSAEPLVQTLRQADERLARFNQPRLERVRRAVAQDLERTRSAGVTDVMLLTVRLDELIRQVDDLPLVAAPERRAPVSSPRAATAASGAEPATAAASPADARWPEWVHELGQRWTEVSQHVWQEVRSLVRITPVAHPEAALLAPDQAIHVRQHLKLRLLNARLALLSRQFDTAQADLRDAQVLLDRWFDRSHRRVTLAGESLRQVMAQARLVNVPRPDATLAALATAVSGR